ncbi:hypothetical protein [Geovibrio sp. ADMFC3]
MSRQSRHPAFLWYILMQNTEPTFTGTEERLIPYCIIDSVKKNESGGDNPTAS